MGCTSAKQEKKNIFQDHKNHQANEIKLIKTEKNNQHFHKLSQDKDDREVTKILQPVKAEITDRRPQEILSEIIKLSNNCIDYYNQHDIDQAYKLLKRIQKDIKQLQQRGFEVEMNKHFKTQFIELCHVIEREFQDIIDYNKEITGNGWKIQKDKKNFKIYSKIKDQTVGIKLQSVLNVPFEKFIAVLVQPDHYKHFLPFVKKSEQLKVIRRNCILGSFQLSLPIISNRQAYFQGLAYNRLRSQKECERELFMYTRSFHDRKDLQKEFDYQVKINQKCVQLDYKYVVVKYIPLTQNSGKMIMAVNLDLKLAMLPLSILQMVSISFSTDFYENIVRISNNFEGSVWEKGVKKNPQLFNFIKKVNQEYLRKIHHFTDNST